MAQTIEENKSPKLYNFFDDQYDFNDLSKRVYSGLDSYISTLKYGKKYDSEIREAVSNLMSGVGDGTVTFENGHYSDSLGRYSNNENRKKDVYGWAAKYIYDSMLKSLKYKAPENTNKEKWDNLSLSRAFSRDVFNADRPNELYFILQDPLNLETNTRGTDIRTGIVTNWLDTRVNDLLFDKYPELTNEERQNWIRMAQEASAKLKENGFDPGDYLYLSKVLPGIKWEYMFGTEPTLQLTYQLTLQLILQTPDISLFADYVERESARVDGDSSNMTLNFSDKLGDWTAQLYFSLLDKSNNETLYSYLLTAVNNPNFDFSTVPEFLDAVNGKIPVSGQWVARRAIQILLDRGKLLLDSKNLNIYYIPEMQDTKTHSGFYYDTNSKTLYKRNKQDIPYWRLQLYRDWSGNKVQPWMQEFFTTALYNKNGGVLKFEKGLSFNTIYAGGDNPDIGYNTYLNNVFLDPRMIKLMDVMFNGNLNEYSKFVKNNVDARYSAGINNYLNAKTYIGNDLIRSFNAGYLNNGNTFNYTLFGNSDDDYNNRLNGVAYNYATFIRPSKPIGEGDRWNEDTSKAYTGNGLGLLTYTRVGSLTDANLTNFGSWGDYWKDKGITGAYYYIAEGDKSGLGLWIPTNDTSIAGYKAFSTEEPQEQVTTEVTTEATPDETELTPVLEEPINEELQELTEDKQNLNGATTRSKVYPKGTTTKTEDEFTGGGFGNFMLGITPDLIGAGRLFSSLRTNNKVARTLTEATKPVLKSTYELSSPITGAFSEMQFRNRLAANLRSLAARLFTSDASLQLAGLLEANRLARDLEYQGFLADDKEIKRTREAALARQEDNAKRRSDIANENRSAINNANWQKAQIEAQRLKSNWLSTDNFLQGVESRLRTNIAERRALRLNASMLVALTKYQQALRQLNDDYKRRHPDATLETMLNDQKYIDEVLKLQLRYKYDTFNIGLGKYYKDPYAGIYKKDEIPTYESILNSVSFRNGGKLHSSIMTMINKVIKNESYT